MPSTTYWSRPIAGICSRAISDPVEGMVAGKNTRALAAAVDPPVEGIQWELAPRIDHPRSSRAEIRLARLDQPAFDRLRVVAARLDDEHGDRPEGRVLEARTLAEIERAESGVDEADRSSVSLGDDQAGGVERRLVDDRGN